MSARWPALTPLALLLLAAPARGEVPNLTAAPHIAEGGETARRLHLQLDGAFTFGIGGQSALGAQLHLTGLTALWNAGPATGSLDVGLQLAYGNEPPALAFWLAGVDAQGANHRVQAVATVGHTLHVGQQRRASLGLHVFAGWNHWRSAFTVRYPGEGVEGSATVSRDLFVSGAELKAAYRLSRRVGLHLVAGVPFPTASSYAIGLFFIGAGLSTYLR